TIAKINHLNEKTTWTVPSKTDGFLEALRHERGDLNGLPFAMGDACRTKGERSKQFAIEVNLVRSALQTPQGFQAFREINTVFLGGVSQATVPAAVPTPAPMPAPAPATGGGTP